MKLNWETSTELNNSHFIVERSVDGFDWEEVVKVLGEGNSVVNVSYTTYDNSPLFGVSYYRLKQVDFDGTGSIFKTKVINNITEVNVLVYPNPAKNFLTIVFEDDIIGEFYLYNSLGQLMDLNFTQIDSKYELDISSIPKGIYSLSINKNDKKFSKIIIVD